MGNKSIWVSNSSLNLFANCPRAYYLGYMYRNHSTGNRISIMQPSLALGQVVHRVLENISDLPSASRFSKPLQEIFEGEWNKITGEKGGFISSNEELEYKQRGVEMIARIAEHPGILLNKAVKLKVTGDIPGLAYYNFSEQENIILCGKVDWMEYIPVTESVHIIDFKTGKSEEDNFSLQLPIYMLLASNLQKRRVSKVSYWYLNKDNEPKQIDLPEIDDSYHRILKLALDVKEAREHGKDLKCFNNQGCFSCRPYEMVLKGYGKKVELSEMGQDIFIVKY